MKAMHYKHINKLPLSKFITCITDGDLSVLVLEGQPDRKELEAAWADIQNQYAETLGMLEWKLYLSLYKEVYSLTIKIQMVDLLVSTLRKYYVEQFAKELNKLLSSKCKFDYSNPESYQADLNRCASKSKGFAIQLDLKTIAFKKLQKKMEENEKVTAEYFQSMINVLEEQFHAPIDETATTVFKYIDRVKRLNKQIELNAKRRIL